MLMVKTLAFAQTFTDLYIKYCMERPVCQQCRTRPAAFNYVRQGKTYYRSKCLVCLSDKTKKQSKEAQALAKSGYMLRHECDRCHFVAKHHSQLKIVFLDGNRFNVGRQNLRTYCVNCIAEIAALPSSRSGLVPDF